MQRARTCPFWRISLSVDLSHDERMAKSYYGPKAGDFILSLVGPTPVLWCVSCGSYFVLTDDADDDVKRDAKRSHRHGYRAGGWL